MISTQHDSEVVSKAAVMLKATGIVITPEEKDRFEAARCRAKGIVMFLRQTSPEHWHPAVDGLPGKEGTFRCRWGIVHLCVPGNPVATAACRPPPGGEPYYTPRPEICLQPGGPYTLSPDLPYWIQAGPGGALVSEFSTRSTDEAGRFRDPRVARIPIIG